MQKPCRDFLKGNCKYGAKCKYSHETPQSSGSTSASSSSSRNEQSVCNFFMKNGHCKFADKCKFSHDNPPDSPSPPSSSKRQKVCQFFSTNEWCRFAENCKYSHAAPDAETVSLDDSTSIKKQSIRQSRTSATSSALAIRGVDALISIPESVKEDDNFRRFWRFSLNPNKIDQVFTSQRTARKFILSCLVDAMCGEEQLVLRKLADHTGETSGLEVVRKVIRIQYKTDAGDAKEKYSFQRLFVPLLILTLRLSKSGLQEQINKILNIFWLEIEQWLPNTLECLTQLLESGTLDDPKASSDSLVNNKNETFIFVPGAFTQIFYPLLSLLYEIVTRRKEAAYSDTVFSAVVQLNEHFPEWRLNMEKEDSNKDGESFGLEIIDRNLSRLKDILVDSNTELQFSSTSAKSSSTQTKYYPPPQDVTPPGGRHDNDPFEYTQIKIIPTHNEILCRKTPAVPFNNFRARHWLPHGPRRLLDTHFRLLREDMIAPLRNGISSFVNKLMSDSKTNIINGRFRNQETDLHVPTQNGIPLQPFSSQDVDLLVYENVKIVKFEVTKGEGVVARLSFNPPTMKNIKKPSERELFWERSSRLQFGGLVCLLVNVDCDTEVKLIFGVIADRDIKKLAAESQPSILITFVEDAVPVDVFQIFRDQCSANRKYRIFLVEANKILFEAYRPVLESLQQISPPTLPFHKYIAPTSLPTSKVAVDPPIFARAPEFSYDLSWLVDGESLELFPDSEPSRKRAVTTLKEKSSLDDGQSESLVAALTSELCCIQGPPGTGKSYVGTKIVETLVRNKSKIDLGPILVVCYTNHALDQFLTHLLELGINKLVRIGSRTSDEKIRPFQLNHRLQGIKPAGISQVAEYRKGLERIAGDIKNLSDKIANRKIDDQELFDHLLLVNPYQHDSFLDSNSDDSDDGFEVAKKGKKKYSIIDRWIQGKDIDEKISMRKRLEKARKEPIRKKGKTENVFAVLAEEQVENSTVVQNENIDPTIETQIQSIIIPNSRRPLEELQAITDVWSLSKHERRCLYDDWVCKIIDTYRNEFIDEAEKARQLITQINQIYDHQKIEFLRQQDIIGITSTGAAKFRHILEKVGPRILICEEAGEVLEAHILSCLHPDTQHVVLIGDHLQLRPRVALYELSCDSQSGKRFRFDMSLFERLQLPEYKFPLHTLSIQRRMRPEIADLVRNTLYPNLIDNPNTTEYPSVPGIKGNVVFFHHQNREDKGSKKARFVSMKSHSNDFEVKMIVGLLKYVLNQGYKSDDVVILTPYVGQLIKIRDALKKEYMIFIDERDAEQVNELEDSEDEKEDAEKVGANTTSSTFTVENKGLSRCIRVATIDNYQGEESTVVLISLVRNGGEKIGFLATSNRINVLLSRAKHGMYLLGDANLLSSKSTMWKEVRDILQGRSAIQNSFSIFCQRHPETIREVKSPEEFQIHAPDGGCNLQCDVKLPKCGHTCSLKCHPYNPSHNAISCLKPCARLHPCKHPCRKICYQDCGKCDEVVDPITLECGHIYQKPLCHEVTENKLKCKEVVQKIIPMCGHERLVRCVDDPSEVFCDAICGKALTCGHNCASKCGECIKLTIQQHEMNGIQLPTDSPFLEATHKACKIPCGRALSYCQHNCAASCHPETKECPKCEQLCTIMACEHSSCRHKCSEPCAACVEPCPWECEHRGSCPLPCGAPCTRLPCDERCSRQLDCGCRCPGICGEICPPSNLCPVHCSAEIKDQIVDMIMFSKYSEINADETPIIFLPCAHFFTAETMDGLLSLSNYYTKGTSAGWDPTLPPLPEDFSNIPTCPECRAPIKNVRRYGRMIKKALLDVAEKKFIKMSSDKIHALEEEMANLSVSLDDDFTAKLVRLVQTFGTPKGEAPSEKDLTSCKIPKSQLDGIRQDVISRFDRTRKATNDVLKFIRRSPNQHVYESSVATIKSHQSDVSVDIPIPKPYKRFENECLRLKAEICFKETLLLKDITYKVEASLGSSNKYKQTLLRCYSAYTRRNYDKVFEFMIEALDVLDESTDKRSYMDTSVVLAQYKLSSLEFEWKLAMIDSSINTPELVKSIKDRCLAEVEKLRQLLKNGLNFRDLVLIIENVITQLLKLEENVQNGITEVELKQIVSAMKDDLGSWGGTHWYRCPNGHPYAIGECGGAMQTSTCPECGATIGGASHSLTQGNSASAELNALANRGSAF
ncbi:hypothetical protein BKA69DRAFT_1113975 [Paraphysoderma sedebokerense]|nr:hypothetical protein BKA69DRAFT_1113975 [Paraphysoderma sedebokerense]